LLVQINQAIPSSYGVYFNGWNRTNEPVADTGVSIHHPAGDIKKISTYWQMISSAWWNGLSSHWRVLWATTTNGPNTVQGGSSGSPVFDEEGYIMGDLTGGYASNSCSTPSPAWYGKIWYSWDQNGSTSTTRLKDWLDPDDTGIEKLQGIYQATLPPDVDFTSDTTYIQQSDSIQFNDETTGNPALSWLWVFEGGTPDTSWEQHPLVKYYDYGEFDVSLTVTNVDGTNTEVKSDYITVEQILPPESDFEADTTYIMEGEEVNFTDLSANNPEYWKWIFEGADPDTSWEQNPAYIDYPDPGSFDVTLIAGNLGGSDTLIKTGYIIVEPGIAPETDFTADATQIMIGDTLNFTDLSTGDPTRWTWSFEGGDPNSSYVQHPTGIVYEQEGAYDVQLKSQNAYGSHTVLKEDYILVGAVTVSEINRNKGLLVYPNPTRGNLNIRFLEEEGDLNIKIYNASGALINSIKATNPVNRINIDMSGLQPGFYLLKIETDSTIISRKVSLLGS
jgi:PKD repeat protein